MAAGKKRGKSNDAYYKRAQASNLAVNNRKDRLERHILNHPEDAQAQEALKRGLSYRRKNPKNRQKTWTPEKRWMSQFYRQAGLNGKLALVDNKRRPESKNS